MFNTSVNECLNQLSDSMTFVKSESLGKYNLLPTEILPSITRPNLKNIF